MINYMKALNNTYAKQVHVSIHKLKQQYVDKSTNTLKSQ